MSAVDWTTQLAEQLRWHWDGHLRPHWEGLTDEEMFWEPAPGMWSLRPRTEATAAVQAGAGAFVLEFAMPEPDPPPLTTIAWRLGHILVGIFGQRNAAHFGGQPMTYETIEWPTTADTMLAAIDEQYARWIGAVSALDADAQARPVGEAEGPFAEHPMAELVLHIHREVIHHGAEVCLLRDLYRSR